MISVYMYMLTSIVVKKIIIFPLYRYGIRAPVYLRKKDGQVLYVQESGQSEWTGGSITKSEGSVSVNSLVGSMTFTLLDHITVSRIISLENGFFSHTCNWFTWILNAVKGVALLRVSDWVINFPFPKSACKILTSASTDYLNS